MAPLSVSLELCKCVRVTAMFHYSRVPLRFWPHAVAHMTHVHNRTVQSSATKTPYELLTTRKPDISHLRVWGCPVNITLEPHQRPSKFNPKTRSGINLGVALAHKNAHYVYFPDTRTTNPVYHIPPSGFDEFWMARISYYSNLKLETAPYAQFPIQPNIAPQITPQAPSPRTGAPAPAPAQATAPAAAPPPRHTTSAGADAAAASSDLTAAAEASRRAASCQCSAALL